MASTETLPNENVQAAAKPSIILPILCSLIGASAVGGGMIFFLLHSGKLGGGAPAPVIVTVKAEPTETMPMEPFLVNLADPGAHSYLRATLMLVVAAPAGDKKDDKKADAKAGPDPAMVMEKAELRDTILTVLSDQTSDALLAPQGKEALKKTLIAQLNQTDPNVKVRDIFFTEFLVQR